MRGGPASNVGRRTMRLDEGRSRIEDARSHDAHAWENNSFNSIRIRLHEVKSHSKVSTMKEFPRGVELELRKPRRYPWRSALEDACS